MKLIIEKNPEKRLTEEERKKRIGPGFVYHESSQRLYKVKLLLKNLENEPEVYVNKLAKRVYQIPKLITFLEVLERTKNGIAKIHAGAVSDSNGRVYLFPALSDVGKTTLILNLAQRGFFVLGDDVVALKNDGIVLRIQEEGGIFPHPNNLKSLRLSWKEKLSGFLKYRFFRLPFWQNFLYPNLRVPYQKWGKVKNQGKLMKVYFLERGKKGKKEIGLEEAINKILISSLDLFQPAEFGRRMFFYYAYANNISPNILAERYRKILEDALSGKELVVLFGQTPFEFLELFLKDVNI